MKKQGSKVFVSAGEVAEFNRGWPCSELRSTRAYWFEFESNGDLVDTDVPEHDDGSAATAMADDCRKFLKDDELPEWASPEPDDESCLECGAPRFKGGQHDIGDYNTGHQAIVTKWLGPTNHKGSRVKATCAAGSITLAWQHAFGQEDNHLRAARALADKLEWECQLIGGGLPDNSGNCYVVVRI